MKAIYMSIIHIHSCFASMSSGDIWVYKPLTKEEFNSEPSTETIRDSEFQLYEKYKEDKTYYQVTRGASWSASRDEMLELVKQYEDQGYYVEKPIDYSERRCQREEAEDIKNSKIRADKGYIFYSRPNWEYLQKEAQGGFSDELWNYPAVKKYTGSFCHGYFGHSVRTAELDEYFEDRLKWVSGRTRLPSSWKDICYSYLSSSDARHFGDSLEDKTFEEQKVAIDERIEDMWNSAYIYSRPEHEGTFSSTKELMKKYSSVLF